MRLNKLYAVVWTGMGLFSLSVAKHLKRGTNILEGFCRFPKDIMDAFEILSMWAQCLRNNT